MDAASLLAVMRRGGGNQYYQRVRRLLGSSLIGYWPRYGTIARDVSGNNFNGTHTNVSQSGATPWGSLSSRYNNSFTNIYSAGLVTKLPPENFTVVMWWTNAAWQDTSSEYLFSAVADGNNWLVMQKNNNYLLCGYKGSGTSRDLPIYHGLVGSSAFNMIAWSVNRSSDVSKVWINGKAYEETVASIPAWGASGINSSYFGFGAYNTSLVGPVLGGDMGDALLLNRAITDSEAEKICAYAVKPVRVSILGDSISAYGGPRWHNYVAEARPQRWIVSNYAAGGHSIMGHMDAQTVSAANGNANIIIVELGTNDADNAGITAEYTENLNELKASNPGATIYCMGVLPRIGGNGAVNNPRIQTAATNAGCTYWDTTGWIDPATDTSDGTHPTAAGHAKIAAEVLARLP